MKPPPPGLRALWLAAIALQVTLPGAAAVADARLEQAAAQATTHIESQTAKACARMHPPDCALCRFLTTTFEAPQASTSLAEPRALGRAPDTTLSTPRPARPVGHPLSRAPPPLS